MSERRSLATVEHSVLESAAMGAGGKGTLTRRQAIASAAVRISACAARSRRFVLDLTQRPFVSWRIARRLH